VLLIGGGAAGATVAAAFVPTVLALFGFSGMGVTGGSYAASWQSSMGAAGIGAGTLFASLQSIAMGGVGTSGIIGGVTVGGVMGLTFVHDICKQVDDLGPQNWVVSSSLALIDKGHAGHSWWQRYWSDFEVSKDLTSEKLSALAAVAMDGTGKALASVFDAVRESVASAATSLSASAAAVEYEKLSGLAAESMEGTVKTLTSTAASLSGFLSGDYDQMKTKKATPVESDKVKPEVGGMLVLEEGGQPPLAPTERVDEEEESGLSKMLTELDLADKYLHKLESEGVDMNDLKETLERRGDSALERLLEQVGIDKVVHRHRIANHLVNKLN